MAECDYFMENEEEILRLEWKTEGSVVCRQALWAGLESGMRVADIGCGPGKTTYFLQKIAAPGDAVGVDNSEGRIAFAKKKYGTPGLNFACRDFFEDLSDLDSFDFVWMRFILEYFGSNGPKLVENCARILRPGGILCLIDLDYNCLSHYGMSPRLQRSLASLIEDVQRKSDFDPFSGRKLYSHLYDLGFEDLDVKVEPHHLIFGELNEKDAFNWRKKLEVAVKRTGFDFPEYLGGFQEFADEFNTFFASKRRFTYTPVILCRGRKPLA